MFPCKGDIFTTHLRAPQTLKMIEKENLCRENYERPRSLTGQMIEWRRRPTGQTIKRRRRPAGYFIDRGNDRFQIQTWLVLGVIHPVVHPNRPMRWRRRLRRRLCRRRRRWFLIAGTIFACAFSTILLLCGECDLAFNTRLKPSGSNSKSDLSSVACGVRYSAHLSEFPSLHNLIVVIWTV